MICLSGLWLLHLVLNATFIIGDSEVPAWSDHVLHLTRTYDALLYLRLHGLAGLLDPPPLSTPQWPPLIYWVNAVLAYLVDPSLPALRLYNIIFVGLLLVGAYWLGAQLHGRSVGLLAAVVVSCLPGLTAGSCQYGLDFPSAAGVVLASAALLSTRDFSRLGPSLLFGLILGLATLVRGQTVFFVAGPLLLGAVRLARRRAARELGHALLAGAVALGLSAPWWAHQLPTVLISLGRHFQTSRLPAYEGDPSLWAGVAIYAEALVNNTSLLLLAASVPLAVLGIVRRTTRHWPELLLWLGGSLLIYIVSQVHSPRYTLPLLPVLPALGAAGALAIRRATTRRLTAGALVLLGLATLFGCRLLVVGSDARRSMLADRLCAGCVARAGCIYYGQRPAFVPEMTRKMTDTIERRNPGGRGAVLFDRLGYLAPYTALEEQTLVLARARLPYLVHVRLDEVHSGGPALWKREAIGPRPTFYLLDGLGRPGPPGARQAARSRGGSWTISLWELPPDEVRFLDGVRCVDST